MAKHLAKKYEGNICKLNGIQTIHAGLEFSDGDRSVPAKSPETSGMLEYRDQSIETTPPNPPFAEDALPVSGDGIAGEEEVGESISAELLTAAKSIVSRFSPILRNCGFHSAGALASEALTVSREINFTEIDALCKLTDACRYAASAPGIHSPDRVARSKARNGLGADWMGKTQAEVFGAARRGFRPATRRRNPRAASSARRCRKSRRRGYGAAKLR